MYVRNVLYIYEALFQNSNFIERVKGSSISYMQYLKKYL